MHLIEKVDVEGFWDTYRLTVALNKDVTFFIGQNGTGRTTLINLLAAALTADFATLEKLPFKKITISLTKDEFGKRPTIIVNKTQRKEKTLELIDYRIKPDEGAPDTKYSLTEDEERIWLRRREMGPRYMQDYYRHFASGIVAALNDLVKVDWLSVYRTPVLERARDERTYQLTVDRRLELISNDLVRYFASLSKQKDEQVRKFQEFIFVSLLEQLSDTQLFDTKFEKRFDEHRHSMAEIFQELRVSRQDTPDLIDSFYSRAHELFQKMQSPDPAYSPSDLSNISGFPSH